VWRFVRKSLAWLALAGSFSCQKPQREDHRPLLSYEFNLQDARSTVADRQQRAALIKDGAKQFGVTNAVLLAGIASAETGLSHCWKEATWACKGPPSPDCDGGPVIAGSGDGPCDLQQGGLCMFQFDSGRFEETLKRYSQEILTVKGCTAAVVPFLSARAVQSVPHISTEAEAIAWMNRLVIKEGDPDFEEWIRFVSWRYNGCKDCLNVEAKYRERTLKIYAEFGGDFWQSSSSSSGSDQCSIMSVSGLTPRESLKVRRHLEALKEDTVIARLLNNQKVRVIQEQQEPVVTHHLKPTESSDKWFQIEGYQPRGEKVEGWVHSLYLSCSL
jgi:hypothetical protein